MSPKGPKKPNKPKKERRMQLMDMSLNDMKDKLSGGASLVVEHQDLTMRARSVDDDGFAVVGKRNGQVVIVDGAAGLTNLLRVMEQYAPLDSWALAEDAGMPRG